MAKRNTMRAMTIALIIALLSMGTFALADTAQAGYNYELPEGFTAEETVSEDGLGFGLTLTDGSLTIALAFSQVDELAGTDLAAATEEDIAAILALMGIDTEEMGLTVELSEYEVEDGATYPLIILYNDAETQAHFIEVDEDGFVTYYAIASAAGESVSDEQIDILYSFMDSLEWIEE
ncbi:MAG: hypothetical protein LBD16_02380 [Oscillospiraceae bacterium]|jgi:hypothetical protein|nr:hypothetical protein [Oscillospiraceae bacterium]